MVDVVISEEKLSQFAPDISAVDLYQIKTLEDFTAWLEDDYHPAVLAQTELLQALNDNEEQMGEAYEAMQHLLKVESFIERAKAEPRGWVFWTEESRDRRLNLTARPLDAAPYFKQLVADQTPVRIYLSAFLGPKVIFCSELGLVPSRVAWMRQASPFAVERRPVHLLSVGSMSRQNQESSLPSVLKMVVRIVQAHPDTRGIVHTNSYRLADAVVQACADAGLGGRILYPRSSDEREAFMAQHAAMPGGVLVSPSVGEGFDFRGDLARWQIVVKCPYLSLGDQHTAVRAEQDPAWYQSETVKHFLQICGRIVRHSEDNGTTFVLDSDVERVLRETRDALPRWFRSAIFTAQGEPFFAD